VVAALTDNPDRFKEESRVYLEQPQVAEFEIATVHQSGSQIYLTFAGIETRAAAEKLVGAFISVARERLPELPAGGYYHFELIGMSVYSETDEYLGEIAEVIAMPANDIWRVEGERDFLLPATANVVIKVDKEKRRVIIRLLDGLID